MTIIPDQTGLGAQDRRHIDMARQLAAIGTVAGLREHAGTDDVVCALVDFWGAARQALTDLIAIAERATGPDDADADEDRGDEDDRLGEYDDDDFEPYCTVTRCGATVGIFVAHGEAWLHYTGAGTADDPVELFDPGHPAAVAWRPAGAR
jgi:hypothetical protein